MASVQVPPADGSATAGAQPRVTALAAEILRYLDRHPNAADTIEGIAQWWLSTQRLHDSVAQVQAAVDALVDRQLVEALPTIGGRVRYRRRAAGEAEGAG